MPQRPKAQIFRTISVTKIAVKARFARSTFLARFGFRRPRGVSIVSTIDEAMIAAKMKLSKNRWRTMRMQRRRIGKSWGMQKQHGLFFL